jgi:P-type Ca2+ transporter type 2C
VSVVSRVSPADKLALVEALRRAGEIVAMAGDGINDGPALKVADVGIAVGPRATDLARHVADVVLQTEDLQSILAAVGEGRIVQDNLRRAVRFLFATNSSELLLMVGAALAGAREPLTPVQLLFINLLTDTLPALALASEPGDRRVLKRPPARPDAPILSQAMVRQVARDGLLMALLGAAAGLVGGPPLAFSALAGAQLAYTLRCRAPDAPPNPRLVSIVAGTAAAQALALVLPLTRSFLQLAGSPLATLSGFAAGFALPLLAGRLTADELVVRAAPPEPALKEVSAQ